MLGSQNVSCVYIDARYMGVQNAPAGSGGLAPRRVHPVELILCVVPHPPGSAKIAGSS